MSCKVRPGRFIPSYCKMQSTQEAIDNKSTTAHTMTIVFYSCNRSTYRPGSDTTVGVRSTENKKFLLHANKQAKIYLLDCSNELIEELTLENSKAVNESRLSWVM